MVSSSEAESSPSAPLSFSLIDAGVGPAGEPACPHSPLSALEHEAAGSEAPAALRTLPVALTHALSAPTSAALALNGPWASSAAAFDASVTVIFRFWSSTHSAEYASPRPVVAKTTSAPAALGARSSSSAASCGALRAWLRAMPPRSVGAEKLIVM